jgi:tetratricopeptide (TPR) repeat protein
MTARRLLVGAVLLFFPVPVSGQSVIEDFPEFPAPTAATLRRPTEAQRRHYEALRLFAKGRQCERARKLLEAIEAYEQALAVEPKATAVVKALIPLNFMMNREAKALEYCRTALELDPNDYHLWYRYAQELLELGRRGEALTAFTRATAIPAAQEFPSVYAQMLFSKATILEDMKQFRAAAADFAEVVKVLDNTEALLADPTAVELDRLKEETAKTCERLAQVYLKAGQYREAVAAFQKAQQKSPAQAGRLDYHLTEVFLAAKQPAQALAHLEKYLATQPQGAQAYQRLVDVYLQLGRPQDILPALEKAAARDNFNVPLKLLLAHRYAVAGRAHQAEPIYLGVLGSNPSEDAYRGLALLYARQDRWPELLQRLDADLADPVKSPLARVQVEVLASDRELVKGVGVAACRKTVRGEAMTYNTRRVLATLCRQARHFDLAEHLCRACLADDPQPGEAYLELCRTLNEAGDHVGEAAVCREALGQKLRVPPAVFQMELARALVLSGNTREGVQQARLVVQQTPAGTEDHFHARHRLTVVLYQAGQLDEAAKEGHALLDETFDPRAGRRVRELLSGIHAARKDYAKAEEHLQAILNVDPSDATACNDLGYLWADQGKNLEEAERLVRRALELDRLEKAKTHGPMENPAAKAENAAYIDSLGWVLFKRGRFAEAAQLLEKAVALPDGDDPATWDHLGDAYEALRDYAHAREAWQKALTLYAGRPPRPDDRRLEIQAKLKRVEVIRTGTTRNNQR